MLNTKSSLKHRIMAVRFALWDLPLYLDTLCGDSAAEELLRKYEEQYQARKDEYDCQYGCISSMGRKCESWLTKPFPWDNMGGDC